MGGFRNPAGWSWLALGPPQTPPFLFPLSGIRMALMGKHHKFPSWHSTAFALWRLVVFLFLV